MTSAGKDLAQKHTHSDPIDKKKKVGTDYGYHIPVEVVLVECARAAGYELERHLQGETLDAAASCQTVPNWWFDKRLVYPVL